MGWGDWVGFGRVHGRWGKRIGLAIATAMMVFGVALPFSPAAPVADAPVTDYDLAQTAPFNQITSYPAQPLPTSPQLRPNGNWTGRLILPTEPDYAADPGDWVWIEIWHGAEGFPDLTGQIIKLAWKPNPRLETYLQTVTRDVAFTPQAERSLARGNVLPTRLNGRRQVGPLQSLAGARPKDDVTVRIDEADLVFEGDRPVLLTGLEPTQITGQEYGLVKILGPDLSVQAPLPQQCPGAPPCPTEFFRVQFFNPAAKNFTGPIGTVRIPQQPMVRGERFFSNLRDLARSPAGAAGWYIYGSRDRQGVFTVQSLMPRALFQLQPSQVVLGETAGLNYINRQNWRDTPQRKGTLQRVLVSPNQQTAEAALAQWQEGDYALVIHAFGGIGGENAEPTPMGTVTGHFAYGLARVVREPITQELQFRFQYHQVYAQNPNAILSGAHDWADYMGDMQRGWLGQRPVSDVIVKLDSFIAPLQFGDTRISLFRELMIQTQIMMARYRTGDGTGVASVTPATSCVQDSNQALFIATQQVRRQIEENPEIVQWVLQNPDSPEAQRAMQFVALGRALRDMLTPYGVIRPDWENNAESLAGIVPQGDFISDQGLLAGALSWQSMMPRWSHDQVARIFLEHGAQLWFLRTNMAGGDDPRIEPIPPTGLFGLIPVLGRSAQRFADAFATGLSWPMGGLGLIVLGLYGWLAVPYGCRNGLLTWRWAQVNPLKLVLGSLGLFLVALVEETVFRVMILPHPVEGIAGGPWLLWGLVSFGLFTLYPWLLGKTLLQRAQPTLCSPRFLVLVGWLGLCLIGLYWITGSLWLVTLVHWIVALVWIYGLGGYERLQSKGWGRPRQVGVAGAAA
ncbi:MAG TPA: CPBP family intramembrane metalloprotease domain-containing protein [Leptolyngbyaceae cyanobacterium M65_K2018_010]|nr:CPBP family intramembrane metalloprotease domain-containing protein [Leptolyngbyaceae cyanobacterium M65_K2018_010]